MTATGTGVATGEGSATAGAARTTGVPRVWRRERQEFSAEFTLTPDDHLSVAFVERDYISLPVFAGLLGVLALFVSLIATYDLMQSGRIAVFLAVNAGVVLAAVAAAWLLVKPYRRLLQWLKRRSLARQALIDIPVRLVATEDGLDALWRGQNNHCPWHTFAAIEEEDGTFYFWISMLVAYIWPARVFASPEERDAFRAALTEWAGQAPVSPPVLARMGGMRRATAVAEAEERTLREVRAASKAAAGTPEQRAH